MSKKIKYENNGSVRVVSQSDCSGNDYIPSYPLLSPCVFSYIGRIL